MLLSISGWKEGEDLEEFLLTTERRLRAAEIKEEEWMSIVDARLSGNISTAWQDIIATAGDYREAKNRLLKLCGYTPKLAADGFFGFKAEQSRGLTADQLYHRGQQLLRRVLAPHRVSEDAEFALLKGWVGTVVSKRARAALDARVTENASDLINALQDFLVLEGDRSEGQAVIFKKSVGEGKERATALTCFKCGKVGHKAIDCWQGKGSSQSKVVPTGGSSGYKITCFTCGEEGHKSPQCPRNNKGEKPGTKEARPKPVKRVWHGQTGCVQLEGVVNGHVTMVLLDSGADITLVPESLVDPNQKTGRTVAVKPFGAQKPLLLPTADISFRIGELEWVEGVAVVPRQERVEEEVLYSLNLKSRRGWELVLLVNEVDQKDILRMTTRAQSKADEQEAEREEVELVMDRPKATPLVPSGQEVCDEPGEGVESEAVMQDVLCRQDEECEMLLGIEKDTSDMLEEELYQIREESGEEPDLVVPLVKEGKGDRKALVAESEKDPTLEKWRLLADKGESGFIWRKGLLYQEVTTHTLDKVLVLVLPQAFRKKVLVLAHDKMQHMGARRVTSLIRQRFTWPGVGQDIIQFCRACPICQKCSKTKSRKALMVERPVLSEPFEVIAVDLVGPMPKGRGGCMYLLTAICMATR